MKKNLTSMMLLIGASFILFTGCEKNDNDLSTANTNSPTGGVKSLGTRTPVVITALNPDGVFPNQTGTFTASGGLVTSGNCSMNVNVIGYTAHCVLVLEPSTGGTITIAMQCEFVTTPYKGRWEIVSGTGAYANLKGNGSLLMPDDITEAMEGFIY